MQYHRLLFVFPLLLLLLGFFHPITALNQDLGRHLLTGGIIVHSGQIPLTNLFSYTYPDFPFINHHWLSEVFFYLLNSLLGMPGLFVLSLALIIAAFSLVLFTASKKADAITLCGIAIVLVRVILERTDLRPELFSFLFLALFISLLYRFREHATRLIFVLVPLQLLWVNTHIYFPIGILVLLLFVLDNLVYYRKNLFNTSTKLLLLVFALCSIVTLINPHGFEGATYPLRVFQNYGYTIEENQTPFFLQSLGFAKPSFLYVEIAVAIFFSSLILMYKKSSVIDWLLALVFTLIALQAVRNFPLFAFAILIPWSRALTNLVNSLQKILPGERIRLVKTLSIVCVVGLFCWQANTLLSRSAVGYGVYEDGKTGLDFVKEHHLQGPIFNNFDIGSYIESRAYPTLHVFIDGRPEAYPSSFFKDTYIPMQENPTIFATVATHYAFNTIIFSHTDQTPWAEKFIGSITQDPAWVTVYLDPTLIVLVKNTPQNAPVIKNFGYLPQKLTMTLPHDTRLLRQVAHFYSLTNNRAALKQTLLQLLINNPTDCSMLQTLLSLSTEDSDAALQIYQQKYQLSCMK